MDDHTGPPVSPTNQPPSRGSDSRINTSLGAVILIAIGALLFLDNLGFIPFADIRAFWPLGVSVWGVLMLTRARGCGPVWPTTLIAIGILLTLGNLNILRVNAGSIWPIFLIAAGVSMLFKRAGRGAGGRSWRNAFTQSSRCPNEGSGKWRNLDANAVFSAVNRRIDSPNFERAEVNAVFGEVKIDLRGATISSPTRQATMETNVAFGAIKLRIPETWKVVVHGNAVFGAYEDKTVPPRPGPGIDIPTLIVDGNAAFGAVEIEN
jgi:predicted membrane protein